MAQLRDSYEQFQLLDTEIVVIGPDDAASFAQHWEREQLPFQGLPDPSGSTLRRLGQKVEWLKLGRMPAALLIDKQGTVRAVHRGRSMADTPSVPVLLAAVQRLQERQQPEAAGGSD